jgi:KaiC/GvpD/RAD55 family RecA-like ATPase
LEKSKGAAATSSGLEEVPPELQTIEKDSITLVVADSIKYMEVITKLLKFVATQKFSVIYVTMSRPYESLIALLNKKGISYSKVLFIDAITPTLGGNPKRVKNCIFVASPSNLTDLGIALEQAISSLGQANKLLIFDSMSTMAIYHNLQTVLQFGHFLTVRVRLHKVQGVLLAIEAESEKAILDSLAQFCDRTVFWKLE